MADGQDVTQQPDDPTQQQQPQSIPGGNGSGFFHGLVGTLISGMATRAVQGAQAGAASMAQNPRLAPQVRSMAAGMQGKQFAKAQQDEDTERQLRVATARMNLQILKHTLSQEDEEKQKQWYGVNQAFAQKMDDQGKLEWVGGTTDNYNSLMDKLRDEQKKTPDQLVNIWARGGSTYDRPIYQIGRAMNDPLDEEISVQAHDGHDDSGLPPAQLTAPKGMSANDAAISATHQAKTGAVDQILANNAPAVTNPLPQTTEQELIQSLRAHGAWVPQNIDELYKIANYQMDDSKLKETSAGRELGRDKGARFIQKYINPNYDPIRTKEFGETRKNLEKYESEGGFGTYKDDKAPEAADYAARIGADPNAPPALKQISFRVYNEALDAKKRHQEEKAADEAAAETHAVNVEVRKAQALAPDIGGITKRMSSGRQYIAQEDLGSGPSADYARQEASKAGIPVIDKNDAGTLADIDTAKANQRYMLNSLMSKLASDPTGRIFTSVENTLDKIIQSDPTLGAIGTYRNAAIQTMKGIIGRQGLRINQNEIQMALDNDIPQMTDTLPTAIMRLQNLQRFLDNAERSYLVQDRSKPEQITPPKVKTFSRSLFKKNNPNATPEQIDAAAKAAQSKGLTVAP